jgi:hypothetical protein
MLAVIVKMVPEMEWDGEGRLRKGVAEVGINALNGGGYRVKNGKGVKEVKVDKVSKVDKADAMGKEGVKLESLNMSAVRRSDEVYFKSKSEIALLTSVKGADNKRERALKRRGIF